MTTQEVVEVVEAEGLGNAIQLYVDGDDLDDVELGIMFTEARDLMNRIEARLPSEDEE